MNQKLIIGIIAIIVVATGVGVYSSNNPKAEMVKNDVIEKVGSVMDKEKDNAMMDDSHVLGVLFLKGKIMTVWEMNELSALEHDIILKNGTKVTEDGRITNSAGLAINLKEGQELTTDGVIKMVDVSKMMIFKENEAMVKKDTGTKTDVMMKVGSYEAYSQEKMAMASSTHNVVLFFHASWCPTCIALDKDIKAHSKDIPANLTILDVDYDNSTPLKKKYGVTVQHTLVEVDANGNLIKKWLGSPTLATLVSEVK